MTRELASYRPLKRINLLEAIGRGLWALVWGLLNLAALFSLPLVIRVLLVPWIWLIGAVVLVVLVLRALFRLVRRP
jgi:hypothetical protein